MRRCPHDTRKNTGAVDFIPSRTERGLTFLCVTSLVGILAERDLLLAATRYLQSGIDVADIMHRDVVTVSPDTPLEHAAALLARHKIGGLPVIAGKGEVVGVITETDMLVALVDTLVGAGPGMPPAAVRPAAKAGLKPRRRTRGRQDRHQHSGSVPK